MNTLNDVERVEFRRELRLLKADLQHLLKEIENIGEKK